MTTNGTHVVDDDTPIDPVPPIDDGDPIDPDEDPTTRTRGRVPPNDLDAEALVLADAIISPDSLALVLDILKPECFYSEANRRIFEAVIALDAAEREIDGVSIAGYLRDHNRLAQCGGSAYIAQIIGSTPAVSHVEEHATRVLELARVRGLISSCQRIAAEGYLNVGDAREFVDGALRSINELAEHRDSSRSLFGGCWAAELGDLADPPPAQSWLLKDAIGDRPAIPMGRAGMLAATGGTSKTTTCAQLSVAVALGRSWLGFDVQAAGRVALVCAESDHGTVRRHLWRACNAEGLSRDERAVVAKSIRVLPLAGREVALLRRAEHGNLERTAAYRELRGKLERLAIDEGFTWSLIVLDPLVRFAGPDAEVDNASATRFVEAVESFCELPGRPTVLVTHHSSKASGRSGGNDSRGVTGLRDGFRFLLLLTKVSTERFVGAHLVCDKNNEAPEFEPRFLVRQEREHLADGWIDVGGTLRLATDEEAATLAAAAGVVTGTTETRRAERETRRETTKIERAQGRRTALLGCVPVAPRFASTTEVELAMEKAGLAKSAKGTTAELKALVELKVVTDLSDGARGSARQWARLTGGVRS